MARRIQYIIRYDKLNIFFLSTQFYFHIVGWFMNLKYINGLNNEQTIQELRLNNYF